MIDFSDILIVVVGLLFRSEQILLDRIMEEVRKDTIATADEVMQYFTNVMRGEVKDQFGLDAPLTERTRAAQEIARRTIDIDIKERLMQEVDDKPIQITLNWARNDNS